jgi:hypothetical protein
VLFLEALIDNAGIVIAELSIDGTQFQTYLVYTLAIDDGLPCPLLPQDTFFHDIPSFFRVV